MRNDYGGQRLVSSVAVAVVGAIAGVWLLVASMVLSVVGAEAACAQTATGEIECGRG